MFKTFFLYKVINALIPFLLILSSLVTAHDTERTLSRNTTKFDNISNEDGLSQVSVFSIVQDHLGFLWFGSMDGLNRYDGYTFSVFRNDPYDTSSLSNNRVRIIIEDTEQALWIGTDNGLNRFHPGRETFTVYKNIAGDGTSLSNNYINCILEDRKNTIWVGTSNGLNSLSRNENGFRRYSSKTENAGGLPSDAVISLYEDNSGILWIGTSAGLCRFGPESGSFSKFDHPLLTGKAIQSVFQDKDGDFWIGTSDGLVHYDPSSDQFRIFLHDPSDPRSLVDNNITDIFQDSFGTIWIGTVNGLSRFERGKQGFINNTYDQYDPYSIQENHVTTIFEDRSGIVWIGTFGGGVHKYDFRKQRFRSYTQKPYTDNTLSDKLVYAFAHEGKNIIWIGTNDGLDRLNRSTGVYTHYKHIPGNPATINDNRIRALLKDSNTLWIASYGGLNRLDLTTGTVRSFKNNALSADPFNDIAISRIYKDKSGDLWLGSNTEGLFRYNTSSGKMIRYDESDGSPIQLSSQYIRSILEDDQGYVWIGTYGGGLNRLDLKNQTVRIYQTNSADTTTISSNFVYCAYSDKEGNLWFGTFGGGLNLYLPESDSFIHFNESNGLPNNVIYGILEDDESNLWISTNRGLSKFHYAGIKESRDTVRTRFRNYDRLDGLQNNEFNFGSNHKNDDGELFFGGINGFTVFYPSSITDNPYIPKVAITDFRVFNEPVKIGPEQPIRRQITHESFVELSHRQRSFSFEFAALHFRNPEKNKYAYMLEGFDEQWTYSDAEHRFANYTQIPGGNYTFRVKASNSDGIWNEEGISLKIKISPPFWETLWFRAFIALFILLITVTIYKIRTYGIKQRNAQLKGINTALNTEIAERKRAEESLRKSEEKYRTLTDNLNAGIYRNIPEGGGRFIEVNPALIKIFGYKSKKALLAMSIEDLYVNPDDRKKFNRKMKRKGYVKNEELLLKKKNGSKIYCSVTAVAVKDPRENIIYYDGLIEDITERKKVEQALRESEEKYRTFVERANDGIIILENSIVKFVNSKMANMAGYTAEEIIGTNFIKYVHPDEHSKLQDRYTRRMQGEEVEHTYETKLINKTGSEVIAEVNAGLINYEGKVVDLVFIRDISERKQLENQIRQTQKLEAIGQLAGGVAHDFNNILTVINGHAELALFRLEEDHPVQKDLREIQKSGERASDLIRQLLAFSRKQMIEPKVLNINQVITNLEKMLKRLIGEDIRMDTRLSPVIPNIKADPSQLEQVLMNLVINARDAIKENEHTLAEKRITIETKSIYLDSLYTQSHPGSRIGPHVLIVISDTGIGMDEKTKANIFDPFFTTKEMGRGTGLGLTTVFGIIKQNDGSIYVYSEPGKGTSFKIYWPVSDSDKPVDIKEKSVKQVYSGSEKILLVEDDKKVRYFAKTALQSFGYSITEAQNGLDAVNLLDSKQDSFDIIISDVIMPEMGGKELAKHVRENKPELHILLTSGYSDTHTLKQEREDPHIHFIHKPYSIQDLARKVREILDIPAFR